MDMSNFRLESHVAQQSRRDKLRVQHNSANQAQHLEEYPSNLEQLSVDEGLNSPDLVQVRNVRPYANMSYELAMFPPEILNFGRNSQLPLAHKDAVMVHQESAAAQTAERPVTAADVSYANSAPNNFNSSSKVSGDPQNCSTWKSIGSQQSCDWIVNYSSGSTGMESNQNPTFVGQGMSGSLKVNSNVCSSPLYMKPNYSGYQDIQTSLTNPCSEISSQNSQRHYEEMHFSSPTSYDQKNLQGVITSAATETEGLAVASLVQPDIRDTGRGPWEDGGSELLLLPTYGNPSSALGLSDALAQINRARWGGELGFLANKSGGDHLRTIASDSNTQGLSLSLSPLPQSKNHASQFNGVYESDRVHPSAEGFSDLSVSKALKSGYLCSNSEPSIGSKGFGNTSHDFVGASTLAHRHTGPLGPFTGYATILKNSKFLKPAQQLLDEFCGATGPKLLKTYEVSAKVSDKAPGEVRVTADAVNATESVVGSKGRETSASTSTFYSSNDICSEAGVGSSSSESYRPEYLQKKAKLLYMQEEVCGRYKQYHQQMQMVVSSFESVAGLSAATPYISLALKTVLRHFKCLKNTISNQLRHIRKALGEDLQSPTAGTSCSKGDTSQSRQKFIDHRFEKLKHGGDSLGFFEPQQHIWRPQRGLPERSVAILRAWLFDHFLHPYPTDTDKHMLATQTGLTRNQVSNWFINARVRVWKPMVEEIHMLETKGLAEANTNPGKNDDKPTTEVASWTNENQTTNRASTNAVPNKQLDGSAGICSLMSTVDGRSAEQWNGEKRSRLDCQIPTSVDDSLIGFVPYQQSGLEVRGLGAVSLTLGLRQSVESAQQQQQLQQQEQQLRQHFGGQMVHDFVG